jgi:16S rRNA (cytosine967-C5)-methyltransferase
MVEEWLELFGEEQTVRLCEAFNKRPQLSCRVNSLKSDRGGLEEAFRREKIKFRPGRYLKDFYTIESKINPERFAPLRKGLVYFQDESAGLPVELLDPQPGERILDLCAAPGGKSTHIAERMGDKGEVLAVDSSQRRLETVKENCRRLGVHSVALCCADARDFRCSQVDRILVDAPCSALGTLGRHSDARWTKQEGDLLRLQKLQLEILSNAAELLRTGGVLVYSTCTVTPEENDSVIERFLEIREDFSLQDGSEFVDPELVDQNGTVKTLPHIHRIDGSFACRLEKT